MTEHGKGDAAAQDEGEDMGDDTGEQQARGEEPQHEDGPAAGERTEEVRTGAEPDDGDPEGADRSRSTARARAAARERRRRYAIRTAVLLLLLALIGGGYYWFGGGYDRYKNNKVLDHACDGVLAKREARAILGDGPLKEGDGGNVREGSFPRTDEDAGENTGKDAESLHMRCAVRRDLEYNAGKPTVEASVALTVRAVPTRGTAEPGYEQLYPAVPRGLAPAPLGHGWSGFFAVEDKGYGDESKAMTAVVLDCAATPSDLLVVAQVEREDSTLDDPDHRAAFARVATATAKKAARHFGCAARLGGDPTTPAQPVNEQEYVAVRDASGTCAGVPAARRSGGHIGVSRAWESARGSAPYESCVIGGETGLGRYRLRALYGPYAEDLRYVVQDQSGPGNHPPDLGKEPAGQVDLPQYHFWWGSAACRTSGQRALFTIEKTPDWDQDGDRRKQLRPDPAYERRALAEFAKRSAASHGCTAPTTP